MATSAPHPQDTRPPVPSNGSAARLTKRPSAATGDRGHRKTRRMWRELISVRERDAAFYREQGRLSLALSLEDHEGLADMFVAPGEVPDSLVQARDVLRLAQHCAKLLERAFLDGELAPSLDPSEDVDALRAFVGRVHRLATTDGPGIPFGMNCVGHSDPQRAYASLDRAEQRRWRLGAMRFVDSRARGRSVEVFDAPCPVSAFDEKTLTRIVAEWPATRGGAKPSGSGRKSKWEMLAKLLRDTWGASVTPKSLQDEWRTANRRT